MAERSSWATQNSGPTGVLDVEESRLAMGGLVYAGANAFKAKSGFRPGPGTSPGLVTATGTPDGFVHVAPFQLLLQSGRATAPGTYFTALDATKDINILATPADPTNPRDDLIVAQQSDTFYGDGNSDFLVRHVVGTPAGSPADPAVSGSADYVALARVRVNASATTITSGNITDLRTAGHAKSLTGGLYSVALGGLLPVASQAQQDALAGLYNGTPIWRSDLKAWLVYDGATWLRYDTQWTDYTPTWTSSGTAPTVGNAQRLGQYKFIGKAYQYKIVFIFGSSSSPGTGNQFFGLPFASKALVSGADWPGGAGVLVDVSTQVRYRFTVSLPTTTTVWLNYGDNNPGVVTHNAPIATWGTGDWFCIEGTVETA